MKFAGALILVAALAAIVLVALDGDEGGTQDVALVGERAAIEVPAPDATPLVADDVALAAAPAPLDTPGRAPARRTDVPTFRVIDATTGERILRGTIRATPRAASWQLEEYARGRHRPPAAYHEQIVEDDEFPDQLTLGPRKRVLWVTAPGYAWAPLLRGEGDDVVELEPAGSLELRFGAATDACALGTLAVTLSREDTTYRPDGGSGALDAQRDDVLRFARIPAGRYDLEVHADDGSEVGALLVRATLDVPAHGSTTHVAAFGTLPSSALEVVALHAPDQPLEAPSIVLRDPESDRNLAYVGAEDWVTEGGTSRGHLACLTPGRYVVTAAELGLSEVVVLTPGETTTLTADLTSFATITARVDGCHEDVHAALVLWGPVDRPDVTFTDFVMPARPVLTWSVPSEPIWIRAFSATGASSPIVVSPAPGEHVEVDVLCTPQLAAQATVHFRWAENTPTLESHEFVTHCRLRAVGHAGRRRFTSMSGDPKERLMVITFVFDAPGRYTLGHPTNWTLSDTETVTLDAGPDARDPIVVELR